MNIHSQLIDTEQPLGDPSRNQVRLARDRVGDRRIVAKRLGAEPHTGLDHVREQLSLLLTLERSGFLGFEDVVRDGDVAVDILFRHVDAVDLAEVHTVGGDEALVDVLLCICQALAHLHSLDYLHGDLKPDNILIERCGDHVQSHVVDLDLSIRRDVQMSRFIQGDLRYIAPEMLAGETLTESIDIFAFGRTVEAYLTDIPSSRLTSDLGTLAQHCARKVIADRPASMWDVFNEIERIGRVHCRRRRTELVLPPLRPAGLAQRVHRLRRTLSPDGDPRTGLCVVRTLPGGGGSRVLRELCLDLQWDGEMTLRATNVTSLAALLKALPDWIRACRQQSDRHGTPILWVVVETLGITDPNAAHVADLNELAIDHSCVLVLEGHDLNSVDIPVDCRRYRLNPLTARECVVATGHLIDDPAVASANEDSLSIAANGNPTLVQLLMRRSLEINRTRSIQEAVNIDEIDGRVLTHWMTQYAQLTEDARRVLDVASVFHSRIPIEVLVRVSDDTTNVTMQLESLTRAGWLAHKGQPADGFYRFGCRTARNAVRVLMGAAAVRRLAGTCLPLLRAAGSADRDQTFDECSLRGLIGDPMSSDDLAHLRRHPGAIIDIKLVLWHMLHHYRRARLDSARIRMQLASDVAFGFASLGSVRRQQSWVRRSLAYVDQLEKSQQLSLDVITLTNRLLETTGEIDARKQWLEQIEAAMSGTDSFARAFVLSELSAIAILKSDGETAAEYAHAAIILFERHAPESESHIRCLNRCGLAYFQLGNLATSRKYLLQSQQSARSRGMDHIYWRSIGNLGYVARADGDPQAAYRYARGISHYYRITDEKISYVTGLRDQVMSLVDLGRLNAAVRASRLAVTLARAMAGPTDYAMSLNNLGWVQSLRGDATEACHNIRESIRLYDSAEAHELSIGPRQNLAWLYLIANLSEKAQSLCADLLAKGVAEKTRRLHVETHCILALAAIQLDAFDAAEAHLTEAFHLAGKQSPKANAAIDSIRLELYLWREDLEAADAMFARITENPIFDRVHPLRLDAARHRGHYHMRRGELDRADVILSRGAEECATSGRFDKHIEAILMRARLANAMGNRHMAARLLAVAQEMINRIRGALDESAV